MRRVRFAVNLMKPRGRFVSIVAKRIMVIVSLYFGRRSGSRPNNILIRSGRRFDNSAIEKVTERASRSEIIARYQPRSEESFIRDFWAAEARKSDTRPLSRNFGRLIITSRAREHGRDVRRRQQ